MLGKVMKYELRASGRLLLPFFGLSLAISAVLRLLLWVAPYIWEPAGAILTAIAGSLGPLLLFAVIGLAFIVVVVRFYQSMLTNEAYLSFTLPITTGVHIWARLIVATLYSTLGLVAAFLCGIIFIPGFGIELILRDLGTIFTVVPVDIILSFIGLAVAVVLLGIVTNLLKIYASLAIGTKLGRNHIIGGIAGYFILNTAESILMLPIIGVIMALLTGRDNTDLNMYFSTRFAASDSIGMARNILGFAWVFVGVISALSLAMAVVHFLLTKYFFSKKLDLE